MSTITCGNCHAQHESVADVKACYASADRAVVENNPPSQKQMDLLQTLLVERDTTHYDSVAINKAMLDKRLASSLITYLLAAPRKAQGKVAARHPAEEATYVAPVTEGMYRIDENIYKVQRAVHGSGNLYAKKLRGNGFVYEPGAITRLRPEYKMTLEQAKEFGMLYGYCCVCGRTLTDETSIANGIGPVCAGKGWWGAND